MNERAPRKAGWSKRDKEASTYRRVATGNVNGKPIVQSDEHMEAR
jgi:hypothetical protein